MFFGTDIRPYLEHAEFLLEKNSQALSCHPRQLGKIGSRAVKISPLMFKVQHIRGSQNVAADAFSRNVCFFSICGPLFSV